MGANREGKENKMTNSNQTGDQVLALANRIATAGSFMDMKEFAVELCVNEGIEPDVAWLALGAAKLINLEEK